MSNFEIFTHGMTENYQSKSIDKSEIQKREIQKILIYYKIFI